MNSKPLAIVIASFSLVGCTASETGTHKLHPDIAVAPESLDFGEVVVLYDESETLQIVNAGRADLVIDNISMADNEDNSFTFTPTSATIEQDDSLAIGIDFAPATYLAYERTLLISNDDPDQPELEVTISGEGVDGPIPDIELDSLSLDFGDVEVGAPVSLWFTITNAGDGPLYIDDTTQSGSGSFDIQTNPDGITLAEQGDYFTVIVTYTATQDSGDSGSFTITSNDPDEEEVSVIFISGDGGDLDYPTALIDCPTSVDPPDTIELDGSGSSDSNGYEPLTYAWAIEDSPTGSTSELSDDDAEETEIWVDLAGTYNVSLTVTNTVDVVSAPDVCEFEAIPDEKLHVEVVWDTANSDVDLHLIQSGSEFFEDPGDCCWCNPYPAWGESGSADDPELALDDRSGYGPETIKINDPYEGDYYIKVHYFEDSGGGTTVATVRVWVDGELLQETSNTLTNNRVWDVGYVRWPEGVFVEEDNEIYRAELKQCWDAEK